MAVAPRMAPNDWLRGKLQAERAPTMDGQVACRTAGDQPTEGNHAPELPQATGQLQGTGRGGPTAS